MKNIILLFLFLIPAFLFAQYPNSGNKSRLGYQTTGDGLIWRGVAADTSIKPRTTANAYFQLDTVNRVLRRYIATQGSWQVVGGGSASIDSLIYATRYWVGSNYFPLEGGTLTGTGGAGFIGFPSQVSAPGTPASGLNIFASGSAFNWKGTDGHERQFASTLTGGRTYTLPDISGTFALGTGTADRSARWTGTNTLGAGSWSDNLTRLQAQVPVQFQSVTTAGLPTGVDLYVLENSTTGFLTRYKSGNWDNIITSTGASANQSAYFSSAGKIIGNDNYTWNNTNELLTLRATSASPNPDRGLILQQENNGIQAAAMQFRKIRVSSAVQNGDLVGAFTFRGYSGTQYIVDNALFGALVTGTVTSGGVPTSLFFNAGSTTANYNTQFLLHSGGNVGIGNFGNITGGAGAITAPTDKLHVRGGNILIDGQTSNVERFATANVANNGTSVRAGFTAWVGGVTGTSTERLLTMQAYAPAYTGSAFGGTFVAGNYVISGLNFNVGASTNQRLHFALGSTSTGTTDTVENVFHRFIHTSSTTLSNSTRFAAISNRGFQVPGTTTSGRVLSKENQFWLSYNIDSTAFNYRDNSGWHMFATRAYARTLFNSAPNFANANLTATATRTHVMQNFATILSNTAGFYLTSGGITPGSSVLSDAVFAHYQYYNLAKTKSLAKYQTTDTRAGIYSQNPNFTDLYEFNFSGSNLYEYCNRTELDTTNTVFIHTYGGKDYPGFIKAMGRRPSSGTIYRTQARFSWLGSTATENETADTYHTQWNTGGDLLMGLKDGGKFLIAADSTMIFDPSVDVPQFNKMGVGNKEAADLSKTESPYLAWIATDGTIIEKASKTEQYHEITSTSSPQTFSNDYSDNFVNQGGTQASFTFLFPASPEDGQILSITWGNAISTLTLDGNGNTITGTAVTTAVAGTRRQFKYYASAATWIKIY